MEQGEILDENSTNCVDEVIFELRFPHKSDFLALEKKLIPALKSLLENTAEISTVSAEDGNENGVCIRAVRKNENGVEEKCADKSDNRKDNGVTENNRSDKEQSPDLTGLSELFMIDTEPAAKLDTVKVPSYKRTIKETMDDNELERKKQKQNEEVQCARPARVATECFNCGSRSHSLRDCPKPRNNQRITRAKRANRHERYHVDIEQRFAHLRPGVITKPLRDALGLRRGELPFFFYRMRVMGYPPGWLEDAKVSHSGIALFNQNGVEVMGSEDDEGEVDGFKHKYDVSKIIDFPGFNADPGANFFDDYDYHNVPPMNNQHTKDEFIKSLGNNIIKGYRRKKLKNLPTADDALPTSVASAIPLEPTDMEIENDDDAAMNTNIEFERPPPPSNETLPCAIVESLPPLPPSLQAESHTESALTVRSQSPSLADLEAQQEQLLQELKANMSNLTDLTDPEDSLIDEVLALDKSQDSTTTSSRDIETPVTPSTPKTPAEPVTPISTTIANATSARKLDIIKTSHVGTPVLKFSPYDKLPAGDNFKVGVSDVINFENLPDATGKYEQMKLVIQKVRNVRQQLNEDDDN